MTLNMWVQFNVSKFFWWENITNQDKHLIQKSCQLLQVKEARQNILLKTCQTNFVDFILTS